MKIWCKDKEEVGEATEIIQLVSAGEYKINNMFCPVQENWPHGGSALSLSY